MPATNFISEIQDAVFRNVNQSMEFEYLRGRPNFMKKLTRSDVNERLEVTTKMARTMPRAIAGCDTRIRVLDDQGDVYEFYLAGRRGRNLRPYFKPKDWLDFMKKRKAKVNDSIYFWREVDEIKGTEYRIDMIPFIDAVLPHPEGLGTPNQPSESPEEALALRTWAAQSLALAS